MERYLIYSLIDPFTEQIRYVGLSSSGMDRPTKHWRIKRSRERTDHCHSWVRSVLSKNAVPEIFVLEEFSEQEGIREILNDAEQFWIGYLRMIGADLTNMTRGGGGTIGVSSWTKGKNISEETKKKMSDSALGRVPWNKGKKTRETHAEAYKRSGEKQRLRKGKFSEETRKKIGEKSAKRAPWNKGLKKQGV